MARAAQSYIQLFVDILQALAANPVVKLVSDKSIMAGEAIYAALTQKDGPEVRKLCQEHPEGPFLALTQRRDSVLQKALYSRQVDLVLDLLADAKQRWQKDFHKKLGEHVNIRKNNILHVAATHDSCIRAAIKILEYADHLITFQNDVGESPIFLAVRYGQLNMFRLLNSQIINIAPQEEYRLSFYKISTGNKTYTILHVAIYNEHFELALYIARTIPSLICQENHMKMTGLHILAMNPSAFRNQYWNWLKLLLPSPFRRLSIAILHEQATADNVKAAAAMAILHEEATADNVKAAAAGSSFTMTIPWWTKIKKEYRRYEAARQLCFILVKKDTKWIELISADKLVTTSASYINDADADSADYAASATAADLQNADADVADSSAPASNHNNGDANTVNIPGSSTQKNSAAAKESVKPPTPLVLAIKYGCLEIARKIIEQHPQTVEQVGPEYGSILHLAIKYRRLEILAAVVNMEMQMRRLVRLRDQEGNSILHMVALNTPKVKVKNGNDATLYDKSKAKSILPWEAEELNDETRSPAFELQDDLLLFELVEEILKTHYHKTLNNDFQTADRLFAANKEPLRDAAQEWMKRTAENCSIVAVLIATVAFAAAYTVPGGSNSDGSPVLLKETFFVVFTVTDVLSLASTLTAVVVFLSILCSSFRFQDFKETLPKSLMFGISCLILSLTMMMLAFAATIILMIKNRQQWTRIALYAVAFLPVSVLVATYLPFYVPLMRTFHYTIHKMKSLLPRFHVQDADIKKLSLISKTKKPTRWSDHSIQV